MAALGFFIMGQSKPAATTLTQLYAVGLGQEAVCSSLVICNQGAGTDLIRVSVRVSGAADDPKQYLLWDMSLASNTTEVLTIGITLDEDESVYVYSNTGDSSFNLFGNERVPI